MRPVSADHLELLRALREMESRLHYAIRGLRPSESPLVPAPPPETDVDRFIAAVVRLADAPARDPQNGDWVGDPSKYAHLVSTPIAGWQIAFANWVEETWRGCDPADVLGGTNVNVGQLRELSAMLRASIQQDADDIGQQEPGAGG